MVAAPEKTVILRPRLQSSDQVLRPTRAEIDLGAIASNYAEVARVAGNARVLAVVKADAYGHGVVPVARRLEREGVFGFGVALAEEGLELREAGLTAAILVLNGVFGNAHREVLERGLTPVVYDLGNVEAFHHAAAGSAFGVHLHVDTGMCCLGVPLRELETFVNRLDRFPGLRIDGLMTHLSCAESDDAFTAEQLQSFTHAMHTVRARGHRPQWHHAGNSAATFRHPSARFDLVRPGLAIFGHPGAEDLKTILRPAMRLRSEVIQLRKLEVGARVGYGGSFTAERSMQIATVPVGYADGLIRATNGPRGAEVLVRGRRCAIVGRISMDLTCIDVTGVPEVSPGDEVVLLGAQRYQNANVVHEDVLSAAELARAAGTIPYEVMCAVSRRVPRFYVG